MFSILGYMAHVQETDIKNVVASGPGLVFVTYPDLVLNLPGSVLWAVIFFTMLLVIMILITIPFKIDQGEITLFFVASNIFQQCKYDTCTLYTI